MTDRKELLFEEERNRKPINKEKLKEQLDEGMALTNMKESRGWKLVYEGFIKKRLSEDRLYDAPSADLADTRAAMRELRELMRFVDSRIEVAQEAAKKIKE